MFSPHLEVIIVIATDASLEVATLSAATMETLQLFKGDTIIVRYVDFFGYCSTDVDGLAKWKKETRHRYALLPSRVRLIMLTMLISSVLIAMSDDNVEEGKILLNKGTSVLHIATINTI